MSNKIEPQRGERTAPSAAPKPKGAECSAAIKAQIKSLDFYYGKFQAIKNLSLDIAENAVTAIIGPSG